MRADCDPVIATWVVYGALEEILTGWVLGQLPGGQDDVERAVSTVVDVAHGGARGVTEIVNLLDSRAGGDRDEGAAASRSAAIARPGDSARR